MNASALTFRLLMDEVLALQTRLDRLQPLSLTIPMTPAAMPYPRSLRLIDAHLLTEKAQLRTHLERLLGELQPLYGAKSDISADMIDRANQSFVNLRLHFNSVLEQIDIFADVLTQRSEHQHDRWLAGLDIAAQDALAVQAITAPTALLTYLDRGHGAAIRRVHTRLPGGSRNPVGLIRIPRERMVGTGIAGSLYHEVGHQAAALLGLLDKLAKWLGQAGSLLPKTAKHWTKWRSEIVADFWAISRLGVAASLGLMSVISLPDSLVYRKDSGDPHPIPWIRVMLNLSIGDALFPDPQWAGLRRCWLKRYPLGKTKERRLFVNLMDEMPAFIRLLIKLTRSDQSINKQGLIALPPNQCRRLFQYWRQEPTQIFKASPTRVFSVVGQARADGEIDSHEESELLHSLLQHWALNGNPTKIVPSIRAA